MFIKRDRSDEIFYREFLTESPKLQETVKSGSEHHFAYEDLSQDLFTMLYEPTPENVEAPIPAGLQIAKQAIEQMKELREYQELHRLTKLDPLAAGLATDNMGKTLQSLLPKLGPKSEKNLEDEIDICKELGLKPAQARAEEALEKLAEKLKKVGGVSVDEDALRQKMRGALADASKAAQEGIDACESFGCGSEPGNPRQISLQEKLEMAKRVGRSDKLKEIAKQAGRLTRIAKKKQMEKMTAHEYTSVKMGDCLARTLPTEFTKLAVPELKPMFFKSYIEKTLLEYELGGKEPQGQGPIICCVDGSGSMAGTPEEVSKGMVMALMEIAKMQKRDFLLIQFASRGQTRAFEITKGECEYLAMLVELEFFFNGGTDFETPLGEAVTYLKQSKYDRADIIFITDGICTISPQFEEEYKRVKKERGFSCTGILIGPQEGAEVMNKFCDEFFNVFDLLNDKKNDAVHERVFKI